MSLLFTPTRIRSLTLPNRLVRSATAECMADPDGHPRPELYTLYRRLAQGGVGLIITGHMYIHPTGKAHPEMTGIYHDDLLPGLEKFAHTIHHEGGLAAVQINHGGMKNDKESQPVAFAPSAHTEADFISRPTQALTEEHIEMLIQAFAQAAGRAQAAGFDAVQIHAAHGYLINQFLSPAVNHRTDRWGGDIEGRMRFLKKVAAAVRGQVGSTFPVLIKLGMADGFEGGLSVEDGLKVISALPQMGIDAVEISGGLGSKTVQSTRKGTRKPAEEAYFLPFAQQAKQVTDLPIILVGGMRSRGVMEKILAGGDADLISMSRPLINQPDLPNLLRLGVQERSNCLSANNCWADEKGVGIACKCPQVVKE